jgi:RNA-directed DNA polymerase
MENFEKWTDGCAIVLGIVYGTIGKKPERKRKNLLRLGVDPDHAYAWSRTRKGGWRVAQSPILGSTITVDRLKKRGYLAMLEYYQQIRSI